ncbi:hypothetical protein B0H17DRAFT_927515, partial [Mycena rosella]
IVRACDCGAEVTKEEQENPVLTIQCSKAGCESIWVRAVFFCTLEEPNSGSIIIEGVSRLKVATEHGSACLAAVENGGGRSTRSWFTIVLGDTVRELVRILEGTDEIVVYNCWCCSEYSKHSKRQAGKLGASGFPKKAI